MFNFKLIKLKFLVRRKLLSVDLLLVLIGYQHVSVCKLIRIIPKEEAVVGVAIARNSLGEPSRKKSKNIYVDLQERINNLCKDYTEGR